MSAAMLERESSVDEQRFWSQYHPKVSHISAEISVFTLLELHLVPDGVIRERDKAKKGKKYSI